MSALNVAEQDVESAFEDMKKFFSDDVWPLIKQFLTVFSPAEVKSLLGDILTAVPTAETSGVAAAEAEVGSEILPQTETNAVSAVEAVVGSESAPTMPVAAPTVEAGS